MKWFEVDGNPKNLFPLNQIALVQHWPVADKGTQVTLHVYLLDGSCVKVCGNRGVEMYQEITQAIADADIPYTVPYISDYDPDDGDLQMGTTFDSSSWPPPGYQLVTEPLSGSQHLIPIETTDEMP